MTGTGAFLEARDGRQRELDRTLARPSPGASSFLFLSVNIPGPDKHRPGTTRLLQEALDRLRTAIGLELLVTGRDLLGPFHLGSAPVAPLAAKQAAMALETGNPWGRLLDVDVYRPDGGQVDRAGLLNPPRSCLVCAEPARECILLARHSSRELLERVDSLLDPWAVRPRRVAADALAANLCLGARRELDLTPKPGLVDRQDSGSHPDLTHAGMTTSIDLLPSYFEDLLRCHRQGLPLEAFVQAGIKAEQRMTRAIQANGHKGFIFLSGILLMAAWGCEGRIDRLRGKLSALAEEIFALTAPVSSHGADLHRRLGVGGVRAEAAAGLPAVFEHGWPRYREALAAGWGPDRAGFYLMAVLMQQVEDSTAISRCGLDGLSRLRRDGASLQRILERQQPPEPWLANLNQDYRKSGLTMGGVADCLALTFALQESSRG